MSVRPLDRQDERIEFRSGLVGEAQSLWNRIRNGDIGSLPVVVGLILIAAVFQTLNPLFLSSINLVNLMLDSAAIGTIAVGVVLVLLLAQIDLSIGSVSGFAAAILAVTFVQLHWPLALTLLVPIVAGAILGMVYGLLFLHFGVPSFVSTLGGLLAVLGFQLYLLGTNGSINLPFDSFIVEFAQTMFLPAIISYALVVIIAVLYVVLALGSSRKRAAGNLSAPSAAGIYVRGVVILVVLAGIVWYLNLSRGVAVMFIFFIAIIGVTAYALKRTRWGRAMYAIGGNVEAARRAGIRVNAVYMSAFVLSSALAAIGGLLAAGRLASATLSSGTGEVNLDAIAAAVIGGTSLFGGRGSAQSALLGILVIEAIASGLNLLNLDSSIRFMITGGVLVVAVIVDSLSRRSRAAHGTA
ncbi:sugar ABC transporter permease [Rathayibacter soli]|uniref:sugar ABC transporter permease n=1 Tax=Rathayibacter soli TaxID=3144168 RepID=UPI0027E3C409|nr:sugar ABC transporter permease [Glaciibacter superstes]